MFTYFVLISVHYLILMMFHSTQNERIMDKEGRRNRHRQVLGLLNIKDHAPFYVLYYGKSVVALLINALLSAISHQSHPPSSLETTTTSYDDDSALETHVTVQYIHYVCMYVLISG